MTDHVIDRPSADEHPGPDDEPAGRSRRRARTVLLAVAAVVVVVVVAAAVWFFFGREAATELSDDQALTEFRATGGGTDGAASDTPGRPAAGVYNATASGTESIGIPGFDDQLGPNAPVTLTHGDGGCSTYRADFNSHHWRSWTFCPTADAEWSLTGLESFTERKAPGLDLATLSTYTCEEPLDLVWSGATAGERRSGACTGTSDTDDAVTRDAGTVEVLAPASITIGGERIEALRVRTVDTFSEAQTGSEVGEWWLHPDHGLPLRISIDAELSGGAGNYSETFELELSTLTPAT